MPIITFRRCGWLCCILVAIGDAVYLFLGNLRGRSFVWGLTDYLELHVALQVLAGEVEGEDGQRLLKGEHVKRRRLDTLVHVRVQDVDEEGVVLEKVVGLQTAAVSDAEVGEKFAVVGCGAREERQVQSSVYFTNQFKCKYK